VVQSALSVPDSGDEGWSRSPQHFAFLPLSPAWSGRGVPAPRKGSRRKNHKGNGRPLPGSCGPRWNNCSISARPSGRVERS
jgi:hypothetical protein